MKKDGCRTLAFVAPAVSRRLLNHDIARVEMHRFAVIEFEPEFTFEDERTLVRRIRGRACSTV
jgi:hypothetical protein